MTELRCNDWKAPLPNTQPAFGHYVESAYLWWPQQPPGGRRPPVWATGPSARRRRRPAPSLLPAVWWTAAPLAACPRPAGNEALVSSARWDSFVSPSVQIQAVWMLPVRVLHWTLQQMMGSWVWLDGKCSPITSFARAFNDERTRMMTMAEQQSVLLFGVAPSLKQDLKICKSICSNWSYLIPFWFIGYLRAAAVFFSQF